MITKQIVDFRPDTIALFKLLDALYTIIEDGSRPDVEDDVIELEQDLDRHCEHHYKKDWFRLYSVWKLSGLT